MKLLRDLLLVALGAVIGNALMSQARDYTPEIDVSYGHCKYKHAGEWIWWSPQYGFNGNMNPKCLEAGFSWPVSTNNGVRLGLIDGGRFDSDNFALWGPDGQTFDASKPCDVKAQTNCLAEFKGHGGMYGVTVGLWRTFHLSGVKIRPEIGGLFYHSWFDVDATPASPDTDKTMDWDHWNHASGNHYTPYIAIAATFKGFGVRYEWFRNVHEAMGERADFFGATNGPMKRLSIVYQF